MKVVKFLPVPLVVAILAFLWILVANKYALLSWVAFLTWGGFFLAGISNKNAIREAISFTLGIFVAWAIVLAATSLSPSLGMYTFPVVVAVAAFIIVFLELVPWFDMAPGYFIGAAAFFAAMTPTKTNDVVALAVLIPGLLGLILGVVTGYFRAAIFKAERSQDPSKHAEVIEPTPMPATPAPVAASPTQ